MSVIEIVLIIIGAGIFLLGYLLPAGKKDADEGVQLISEAEIRKMVEGETETVRERISDIVDETIGYSIEKTERAMERVANEKIMAVNEYSDTVLEEINKNHKEVTFLYDMLNDKHETLLASIGEASQVADTIRQTVRDAEITAGETVKRAKNAEEAAEGALQRIHNAEVSAREAQEAVQEAVQSVMGAVEDTRTDLWSIHSARAYSPEVVEEVQDAGLDRAVEDAREDEDMFAPAPEREFMPAPERQFASVPEREFMPAPERQFVPAPERESVSEEEWEPVSEPEWESVPEQKEIIGDEEEADFQPIRPKRVEIIHEPEADYVAEEQDISTSAAFARLGIFGKKEPEPEEPRGVDIRFAKGQDNGRNSNERILELHKAGKSNMAIAKELGLGLGEVKLVIDLFEGV